MGNDKKEMPEKEDVLKAIIDFFKDIPTDEITAEYIKNVVGCDEESATIMLAVIMHDRGQLREEVKELVLQDDERNCTPMPTAKPALSSAASASPAWSCAPRRCWMSTPIPPRMKSSTLFATTTAAAPVM